ncbi:MAG: hypothetical protein COS26_01430 [Candidatus Nealsonbacteria bacterium CG02_land_8_20_14_3_00_40_11]|uniref:Uncharacterized protein n=1 Tax=Candidatus Nealsonbacteria bacterium CG02_land_8_20_14_3_00_40_11 TaxID=1974700 RepID=A0A2M7D810_9BACT|nr:MAG: hypothetical protein COS26_01430 [Candidatus Nealsonbacteria bacterium CG02_land_8_20_14_3_00_40_11]
MLSKTLILIIAIILATGVIIIWQHFKFSAEEAKSLPESPEVTKELITEEKVSNEGTEEIIPEEETEGKPIKKEPENACQDECSSVGLKGCSNNNYQICGDYDNDSCLEWSSVIFCPESTNCRRGNCIVINLPKPEVEYWAVLFTTHKNNLEPLILKNILINNGWKGNHIKYLLAEDANRDNLLTSLDWLRVNSDVDDVILYYNSSHGSPSSMELMTYSDLAKEFESIKYGGLAIVINACYSGSAIPYLRGENRVILTSSGEDVPTDWGFHTQFFHALWGFGDTEGNNNDWVSMEETFNFLRPSTSVRPRIQDDYAGELDMTFLNGNFSYLDQYNIIESTSTSVNYTVGAPIKEYTTWIAQSFKPDYPVLTKVMLELYKQDGPDAGALTVSIKKDLSGFDLTSITLKQDVFFSENIPKFYEFDFPDVEVVPDETYFIVIGASDAIYGGGVYLNGYNFRGGENNYLKGGAHKVYYPEWLWPIGEFDLFFATFGKPK